MDPWMKFVAQRMAESAPGTYARPVQGPAVPLAPVQGPLPSQVSPLPVLNPQPSQQQIAAAAVAAAYSQPAGPSPAQVSPFPVLNPQPVRPVAPPYQAPAGPAVPLSVTNPAAALATGFGGVVQPPIYKTDPFSPAQVAAFRAGEQRPFGLGPQAASPWSPTPQAAPFTGVLAPAAPGTPTFAEQQAKIANLAGQTGGEDIVGSAVNWAADPTIKAVMTALPYIDKPRQISTSQMGELIHAAANGQTNVPFQLAGIPGGPAYWEVIKKAVAGDKDQINKLYDQGAEMGGGQMLDPATGQMKPVQGEHITGGRAVYEKYFAAASDNWPVYLRLPFRAIFDVVADPTTYLLPGATELGEKAIVKGAAMRGARDAAEVAARDAVTAAAKDAATTGAEVAAKDAAGAVLPTLNPAAPADVTAAKVGSVLPELNPAPAAAKSATAAEVKAASEVVSHPVMGALLQATGLALKAPQEILDTAARIVVGLPIEMVKNLLGDLAEPTAQAIRNRMSQEAGAAAHEVAQAPDQIAMHEATSPGVPTRIFTDENRVPVRPDIAPEPTRVETGAGVDVGAGPVVAPEPQPTRTWTAADIKAERPDWTTEKTATEANRRNVVLRGEKVTPPTLEEAIAGKPRLETGAATDVGAEAAAPTGPVVAPEPPIGTTPLDQHLTPQAMTDLATTPETPGWYIERTPQERSAAIKRGQINETTPIPTGERIVDNVYRDWRLSGDPAKQAQYAAFEEQYAPLAARYNREAAMVDATHYTSFEEKKAVQAVNEVEHVINDVVPSYVHATGGEVPEIAITRERATTATGGKASFEQESTEYLVQRAVYSTDPKAAQDALDYLYKNRWQNAPWRDEMIARLQRARTQVEAIQQAQRGPVTRYEAEKQTVYAVHANGERLKVGPGFGSRKQAMAEADRLNGTLAPKVEAPGITPVASEAPPAVSEAAPAAAEQPASSVQMDPSNASIAASQAAPMPENLAKVVADARTPQEVKDKLLAPLRYSEDGQSVFAYGEWMPRADFEAGILPPHLNAPYESWMQTFERQAQDAADAQRRANMYSSYTSSAPAAPKEKAAWTKPKPEPGETTRISAVKKEGRFNQRVDVTGGNGVEQFTVVSRIGTPSNAPEWELGALENGKRVGGTYASNVTLDDAVATARQLLNLPEAEARSRAQAIMDALKGRANLGFVAPGTQQAQALLDTAGRAGRAIDSRLQSVLDAVGEPRKLAPVSGDLSPKAAADPTLLGDMVRRGSIGPKSYDLMSRPVPGMRNTTYYDVFDSIMARHGMNKDAAIREFQHFYVMREGPAPEITSRLGDVWRTTMAVPKGIAQYNITNVHGIVGDALQDGARMVFEGHGAAFASSVNPVNWIKAMLHRPDAYDELVGRLGMSDPYVEGHFHRTGAASLEQGERTPLSRVVSFGRGGRAGTVADILTEPFDSRLFRKVRNGMDALRRKAVFVDTVQKQYGERQSRWLELSQSRLEKQGLDPSALDSLPDLFTARQAEEAALHAGADADLAGRIARDWKAEVNAMADAGREESGRVLFTFEQTKADALLNNIFYYHYWMTRAYPAYASMAIRNPEFLALWYRTWMASEKQARESGMPESFTGRLRWFGTGGGFYGSMNPWYVLAPTDPGSISNLSNNASLFDKAGQIVAFNPAISMAAAVVGLSNDAPDPTMSYSIRKYVGTVANFGRAHGWWGDTSLGDAPYQTALANTVNFARDLIAKTHLPVTAKRLANDPNGYNEEQLAYVARTVVEEQTGVPFSQWTQKEWDIWNAANVAIKTQDPNNPVANEAFKRWTEAKGANDAGAFLSPGGSRLGYGPRDQGRALSAAGWGQADIGNQPTPAQQGEMDFKTSAQATGEAAPLMALDTQYKALGTPWQQDLSSGWSTLAYGDSMELASYFGGGKVSAPLIQIGGRWLSIHDIAGMSADQRKSLADIWQAERTNPETGASGAVDNAQLRDAQDAFKTANPTYGQYADWKAQARKYPGGEAAWVAAARKGNPNYDAYLKAAKNPDKAALSLNGFLAFSGIKANVYASPAGSVRDMSQVPYNPSEAIGGGSGSNGPTLSRPDQLRKSISDYNAKWAAVAKYLPNGGQGWDQIVPTVRDAYIATLKARGITIPSLPARVATYYEWQALQPKGADTSPEAFFAWLDATGSTDPGTALTGAGATDQLTPAA